MSEGNGIMTLQRLATLAGGLFLTATAAHAHPGHDHSLGFAHDIQHALAHPFSGVVLGCAAGVTCAIMLKQSSAPRWARLGGSALAATGFAIFVGLM